MDDPPAVAELVGIHAVEVEAAVAVLQGRHAVVVALEQQFDRLAAELGGVEAVEEDRPAAALGVADFPDEDGGVGALVAALAGEEGVADLLDQEPFDRLGGPGVLDVAGGVVAGATAPRMCPSVSTIPSETQMTACFWMSRIEITRSTRGPGSTGDSGTRMMSGWP